MKRSAKLAITISYPTSANGIIVFLLLFLKLQTSGYYNWILVNFILNITERPDIDVTSGKSRENHMTYAPFANLAKWKIWKGSKSHNQKENFSHKKRNVDQMFRLKSSSRIKTSKLKSRRSEIIVHLHVEIVRILWSLCDKNYSWQELCSRSLTMTVVEFDARYVDLIARQFRFLSPLNRSCTKTYKSTKCQYFLRCFLYKHL